MASVGVVDVLKILNAEEAAIAVDSNGIRRREAAWCNLSASSSFNKAALFFDEADSYYDLLSVASDVLSFGV